MNIEEVKNELVRRTRNLSVSKPTKSSDPLKTLENKLKNIEKATIKASQDITDELNKILESERIEFDDENEKNVFISKIQPTIKDILQKHIHKSI